MKAFLLICFLLVFGVLGGSLEDSNSPFAAAGGYFNPPGRGKGANSKIKCVRNGVIVTCDIPLVPPGKGWPNLQSTCACCKGPGKVYGCRPN